MNRHTRNTQHVQYMYGLLWAGGGGGGLKMFEKIDA